MPILYPENESRVARAEQLLDECVIWEADSVQMMEEFLLLAAEINDLIRNICEQHGLTVPQVERIEVRVEEYSFYIDLGFGAAAGIADVMFFEKLKDLIVSSMTARNKLTAAQATKVLSKRLGWTGGGIRTGIILTIVTLAVAVGIGLLVGLEEGERQKKAAMDAIQDLLVLRARVYLARARLRILLDAVRGLSTALDIVKSLNSGLTSDDLESIINRAIGNTRTRIEGLTPASAYADLARMDFRRGWNTAYDVPHPREGMHLLSRLNGVSYALDLWGSKRDDNSPIYAGTQIHDRANQSWVWAKLDDKRSFQCVSVLSNKALTIYQNDRNVGAPTVQYVINYLDNQVWFLAKGPAESFFILSKSTGLVVAIGDPLSDVHAWVVMAEPDGDRRQLWTFFPSLFDQLPGGFDLF